MSTQYMLKKYSINSKDTILSSGAFAKRANASVILTLGNTTVLVTFTKTKNFNKNYIPFIVDYRESLSAAGLYPTGFLKKEVRQTEKEISISRLCDRSLRPLLSNNIYYELQIVGLLLSSNLIHEPDILIINAGSAAILCSDVTSNLPIGSVRIGKIEDHILINPTHKDMHFSTLDFIYVGNSNYTIMIDSSSKILEDKSLIYIIMLSHELIQNIINAQNKLAFYIGKKKSIENIFYIYNIFYLYITKFFYRNIFNIKEELIRKKFSIYISNIDIYINYIQNYFKKVNIFYSKTRKDGRNIYSLRSIFCKKNIFSSEHGTAIFKRGKTQVLVTTTLGSIKDNQVIEAITGGIKSKSLILHYNFYPYSTGEIGRLGLPSRREVGHGLLCERSLLPILPNDYTFPYSIRIVSDIMDSDGSTSMATVSGATLSMIDAGVPIDYPISGVSIGLLNDIDNNIILLTDIVEDEDKSGEMDFKITGSKEGITACQLDIKSFALPINLFSECIFLQKNVRNYILSSINISNTNINKNLIFALQIKINTNYIGIIIGNCGSNIKYITNSTNTIIDIDEYHPGNITIQSVDNIGIIYAINELDLIVPDIEMLLLE